MKTTFALILLLSSYQLHALACRCSCDPMDRGICASSYDLEHPCTGACPNQVPGTLITRTACPLAPVYNPVTGLKEWRTMCFD